MSWMHACMCVVTQVDVMCLEACVCLLGFLFTLHVPLLKGRGDANCHPLANRRPLIFKCCIGTVPQSQKHNLSGPGQWFSQKQVEAFTEPLRKNISESKC